MDDSVPVRSRYVSESYKPEDALSLTSTIQSSLGIIRVRLSWCACVCVDAPSPSQNEMYKVFHSILRSPETRKGAVDFLQEIIQLNAKKTRLHVDTRRYSSDGFMLNLLAVMHQLCFKIKLKTVRESVCCCCCQLLRPRPSPPPPPSQVDALYLLRPESESRLAILQETRVYYTSKQVEAKQKEMSK